MTRKGKVERYQDVRTTATTTATTVRGEGRETDLTERKRWFADDDEVGDVRELVRRERFGGRGDMDAAFADNVMRLGRKFKGLKEVSI